MMKLCTLGLIVGVVGIGALAEPGCLPQQRVWQDIKLLQSKPPDVEKLLGQPIQSSAYVRHYKLQDYELWVDYYPFDHCRPRYGKVGEWNVPAWTVTEVLYVPGESVAFSSLYPNLREFRKAHESPHVPAMNSYVDDSKGIDFTLNSDGTTLHSIRYFPSASFKHLRCGEK